MATPPYIISAGITFCLFLVLQNLRQESYRTMDKFIRPHQENKCQPGFWKIANGGSDDEADLEDRIGNKAVEGLDNLDSAASQSSSLAPNDSISQLQSPALLSPFLEPLKSKRQ